MKPVVNEETTSTERPVRRRRRRLIIALVLAALAVTAFLLLRRLPARSGQVAGREVPSVESVAGREVPAVEELSPPAASSAQADLTLPPEMIERIGLREEVVAAQPVANQLRTTGTVQPNAYRETRVTPLVGGRVTEVRVQLGDRVKKGQTLAVIFSAELAEAQMQYRKVIADLDAFAAQHERALKLTAMGAMSKQELEQAEAHYRQHHAEHEAAAQKLRLLGLDERQIAALSRENTPIRSEAVVEAPASGVITARTINPGQVVTMSDSLFAVTDLSTVWVIANVYEQDFAALREGASVTITSASFPKRALNGKVSYVDPRVDPQTRTAQVRVEVPNPGQMLKLGMFVDVALTAPGSQQAVAVPKAALQMVNGETVVFVPVGTRSFQMRRVQVGQDAGEFVQIVSGVSAGEKVVTVGSFFLRAEMGRR